MASQILIQSWLPWAVAVLVAGFLSVKTRRLEEAAASHNRSSRIETVAGLLVVAPYALWTIAGTAGWAIPTELWGWRFLAPLAFGVAAVTVLLVSRRNASDPGSADLTPRHAGMFVPLGRRLLAGAMALSAIIAAIAAGAASGPDDLGRYRLFSIPFGEAVASTEIYGWYYSVPCLVAVVLLVGLFALYVGRLTFPGWSRDRETDRAERARRGGNAALLVTGAIALHLGLVLQSLRGAASLRVGLGSDTGLSTGTSFAVLNGVFGVVGYVAVAIGLACCLYVVALIELPVSSAVPRS